MTCLGGKKKQSSFKSREIGRIQGTEHEFFSVSRDHSCLSLTLPLEADGQCNHSKSEEFVERKFRDPAPGHI